MAGAIFLGILPVWASLRQRALDKSIAEINKKMDLNIALDSLERSRHRWVSNDADFRDYASSGNERRLVFPVTSLPNARSKLIPRVLRLYCFRNHRRSARLPNRWQHSTTRLIHFIV